MLFGVAFEELDKRGARRRFAGMTHEPSRIFHVIEGWFIGALPEFDERFAHGELADVGEIELRLVVSDFGGASGVEGGLFEQLFGELDHAAVIGVGLIELEHGELRIVADRDAFVAEVAIDFVYAFKAADDEALEIKFRSDAEIKIDIERVVMRLKGAGGGAAIERLHHGRFDFEEAMGV